MTTGIVGVVTPSGSLGRLQITYATGAIPANEISLLTNYFSAVGGYAPGLGATTNYTVNNVSALPSYGSSLYFSGEHNDNVTVIGAGIRNSAWATSYAGSVISSTNAYITLAHQNRVIYAAIAAPSFQFVYQMNGTGPIVASIEDLITYTLAFVPTAGIYGQPTSQLYVGEDQMALIGAFGTVAADQLLIVKGRDGGVLISGDLDFPTIRRMPYIESTHGTVSKPAMTPIGLVYGSKSGVFVWAGGDTSTKLSQQLDGFFWNHTAGVATDDIYTAYRGRFCYWNGFVMVPNNYVYNLTTESWWRLSGNAGAAYNCYDEDTLGRCYAFPYKLTPTQNTVYDIYDQAILSNTYSWQSQPLLESRGRYLSVQQIEATITHRGTSTATVTVTVTGYSETGALITSRATALSVDPNPAPQTFKADIIASTGNFTAQHVQILITANSNNTAEAAPKIHGFRLGVKDRARTPKNS